MSGLVLFMPFKRHKAFPWECSFKITHQETSGVGGSRWFSLPSSTVNAITVNNPFSCVKEQTWQLCCLLDYRKKNSVLGSCFMGIFVGANSVGTKSKMVCQACGGERVCVVYLMVLICYWCISEIQTCACSCNLPVLWDLPTLNVCCLKTFLRRKQGI